MIGIGVIGAGWWAEQHAATLQRLPGLRLVAACRKEPEALEQFTKRFGGTAYLKVEDLLNDAAVDAVLIASPHHLHAEHAILAAQAGKHLLLEKPMAPTTAECSAIINACATANVQLMIGHTQQFAKAHLIAQSLVQSGELGEVVLGSSIMSKFWMEHNRRDWHLSRETGGGMLLTAGIHALDRLVWLIGFPVVSVSASIGTRFHAQEADDFGLLFLRFANGASGSVASLGYAHGAPTHRTELFGTNAHLRVDPAEGVYVGRHEHWEIIAESRQADWLSQAMEREWLAFDEAIMTQKTPVVSGEYGLHLIEIIEAANLSAASGQEVVVASRF